MFKKLCSTLVRQKSLIHHNFGILFDIDGVLIRGSQPLQEASKMFNFLTENNLINSIPIAYLTNSCDPPAEKAEFLSDLFNHQISPDNLINAPAPLKLYNHLHDKRTLFVTQDDPKKVAKMLNFKYPVSIDEIKRAYPTLDVMDKKIRKSLKENKNEKPIEPIESIIILGEPIEWESYLQIITDLLVTNGQPCTHCPQITDKKCEIIICNLDFLYATEYKLPRFGNGAFINCLEALYEKLTGTRIRYSSVIGKPSEVSFRYAEHVLSCQIAKLATQSSTQPQPLKRIYMIGDNPSSDIMGANLYNQYVKSVSDQNVQLPFYRQIPTNVDLSPQTVTDVKSVLVTTGVYQSGKCPTETQQHQHSIYSHKKIDNQLTQPNMIVDNCLEAVYRILELENVLDAINQNKTER